MINQRPIGDGRRQFVHRAPRKPRPGPLPLLLLLLLLLLLPAAQGAAGKNPPKTQPMYVLYLAGIFF
jgi:hypothetical protein